MECSLGASHGEEARNTPSLSISEHHRPRAIELHKGRTLEQLLVGILPVLQRNVLLRTHVNSVRAVYSHGLILGPLDLEKHLRGLEILGRGLEGGGMTKPLSRLFILVILMLLFPAQEQ